MQKNDALDESTVNVDVSDRPLRDWTIMIYMAGDNNLSADMASQMGNLAGINPSAEGASRNGKKVNLLAYFDSASLTAPTQYIDYTDADADTGEKPITHDVTPYDLILPGDKERGRKPQWDPEESASVRSIVSFVQWCIKRRKAVAKNYVLIFSGHSFGFYGTSFMRDQSSGRFLSLRMFRFALERVRNEFLYPEDWMNGAEATEASVTQKKRRKIAIIGFDSCDMGMLEVGYELKEVAHTIVASAGNVPNAGWGYAPMLRHFVEDNPNFLGTGHAETSEVGGHPGNGSTGDATVGVTSGNTMSGKPFMPITTEPRVQDAARAFVRKYVSEQQRFAIGGNSIDMAALDLDEIQPLAEAIGELGGSLSNLLGLECLVRDGVISEDGAIVHNRTKSLLARTRMSCQSYMHEQAVDIRDFCQKLMFGCREIAHEAKHFGADPGPFPALQDLCQRVITAAETCVLQSGFSGDEYQFSKGISLYFPWTALTYLFTWDVYRNLRFARGDYQDVPRADGRGLEEVRIGPGPGESWDDFLLFYLYVVTLRQSELVDQFETDFGRLDGGTIIDGEWQQTRSNWIQTRDPHARTGRGPQPTGGNWPESSRENWRVGTRENWPLTGTRENWPVTGTRENWPRTGTRWNPLVTGTRHNPLITGDKGMATASDYMSFFGKVRNFMLNWEAAGLWPKPKAGAAEEASLSASSE